MRAYGIGCYLDITAVSRQLSPSDWFKLFLLCINPTTIVVSGTTRCNWHKLTESYPKLLRRSPSAFPRLSTSIFGVSLFPPHPADARVSHPSVRAATLLEILLLILRQAIKPQSTAVGLLARSSSTLISLTHPVLLLHSNFSMQSFLALLAVMALSTSAVQATTYTISDTFVGPSFLTGFTAQAIADPTEGRVKYAYDSWFWNAAPNNLIVFTCT